MAPATPAGLHVDETTASSITWHWSASEGAIGYVVQQNMDGEWDETDTVMFDGVPFTTETHYTATDLEPETMVYVRVAAAAGTPAMPLVSDFSEAVSGTSAMPPPVPTPFMVEFSVPDEAKVPYPMIPDDDDDEATAMAMVNPQMMVTVNMPAIVSSTFVEGAAPIGLIPGPNVPFLYVDWDASQSMVVSTGVTFAVQHVEIGANQVPLPIGDAVLITCGPFECMEGPVAPMLSIANSKVCTDWDPEVSIEVGKVDNDVLNREEPGELEANDGVDLGIKTSSSLGMKVKHIFSGVDGGTNTDSTVDAAKGSDKTLAMKAVTDVILVSADADDTATANTDESIICDNTYTSEDVSSKVDRPGGANCFRLIGPGAGRTDNDASKGADYLSGWSIELSPVDADVMWGNVDWEENPFEDLECEAMDPIMVADHVDICDMFETEVDMATGKGWKPEVVFDANNRVVMWRAGATASTGHERMFKTLWFDDNLNGKILKDTTGRGARRPDPDGDGAGTAALAQARIHDLYDQDEDDNNIDKIWQFLTDDDGDLLDSVGDLGKADLVSDDDDPKTADNETTIALEWCGAGVDWNGTTDAHISTGCGGTDGTDGTAATERTGHVKTNPDGMADNYVDTDPAVDFLDFRGCSEDDGGDDADGSECDAEWVNDVTILFADGTFGCSTTRDITVTCMWDADGGMAQGRNALPNSFIGQGDTSNYANFMKCSAK